MGKVDKLAILANHMDYSPILERITPKEDVSIKINALVTLLSKHLSVLPFKVTISPGGSTAKGTHLAGNTDIDVFLRCHTQEENISDPIEQLVKAVSEEVQTSYERIHGSRDYFQLEFEGSPVELVPTKYVEKSEDIANVTDMSALHVAWVNENLTIEQKQSVRLFKQFAKAQGFYGAESYVNGLSGHVIELLTYFYSSFEDALKAMSEWSATTTIDVTKTGATITNQAKLVSPLVIVDPIDLSRNAAAAVSSEQYEHMKSIAKEFLNTPTQNYFTIPEFSTETILSDKQDGEVVFVLEVVPQVGKKDVVLTKVFKLYEFFLRHLALHEFTVTRSGWHPNEETSYLYYYVNDETLSSTVERAGPPINQEVDVQRFKDAHESAVEKDGRMYATIDRQFTTPQQCIEHLLEQQFVKERCSECQLK